MFIKNALLLIKTNFKSFAYVRLMSKHVFSPEFRLAEAYWRFRFVALASSSD